MLVLGTAVGSWHFRLMQAGGSWRFSIKNVDCQPWNQWASNWEVSWVGCWCPVSAHSIHRSHWGWAFWVLLRSLGPGQCCLWEEIDVQTTFGDAGGDQHAGFFCNSSTGLLAGDKH